MQNIAKKSSSECKFVYYSIERMQQKYMQISLVRLIPTLGYLHVAKIMLIIP